MSHRSFTANVLFTRSVNSHNEPTDHRDSGSSPAVRKFIADHAEFIRVGVSLLSSQKGKVLLQKEYVQILTDVITQKFQQNEVQNNFFQIGR